MDFASARRAFFQDNFNPIGAQNPGAYGIVRFPNDEAFIRRVRLGPTFVEVLTGGSNVVGTRMELNSASQQVARTVPKAKKVRFPVADGLANDGTLYLTRGGQWLDYRTYGPQLGNRLTSIGIEVVEFSTAADEIERLIYEGEGERLEFKVKLPIDGSEKRNFLKDVVAFANTNGGKVVFGVHPDEGTISGLGTIDRVVARDQLIGLMRNGVTDMPPIHGPRELELDGRLLLVLDVEPGEDVPYGVTLKRGDKADFYVRRGASSFPATPLEIRQMVHRHGETPGSNPYFGPLPLR